MSPLLSISLKDKESLIGTGVLCWIGVFREPSEKSLVYGGNFGMGLDMAQ